MKALKKEMGEDEDQDEIETITKNIEKSGMPKDAKDKVNSELNKFKMMPPMSAEASVVRGYIDWMTSIPWKKKSKIQTEITKASEVLDSDHYGLEEVKERILEYLAVHLRPESMLILLLDQFCPSLVLLQNQIFALHSNLLN